MATGYVYDPIFLEHVNPQGHPERVERLTAIQEGLARAGLLRRMAPVAATPATAELLALVHDEAYVSAIDRVAGREGYLDGDTFVSPRSIEAAHKAAGGAAALAEAVWTGQARNGIALLRPPGHHAEAGRAMGFCVFNNVAVAAARLRKLGAARVAIFDWDVHHGNGTQHSFEADPSVLYLSTHQYPFYPGTGAATEVGHGEGRGATVNLPMPAGCGDADYVDALDTIVLPVLEQYKPEAILVSAGFDTYHQDPLGGMQVTERGYQAMAQRMRAAAERLCGGKILYVLEGGYDLQGLALGVKACAADLVDPDGTVSLESPSLSRGWQEARSAILAAQQPYYRF